MFKGFMEKIIKMELWKKIYIVLSLIIFCAIAGAYLRDDTFDFSPNADYSKTEHCYTTDKLAMYPGDYFLTLEYRADKDTQITLLTDYSGEGDTAVLDAGSDEYGFEWHTDTYNDVVRFQYSLENPDDFKLYNIKIKYEKPLFTDHLFIALLFALISGYVFYVLTSKWFKEMERKYKIWLLLVHLAVILVSFPLFSSELFWGADAPPHVMRLDGVRDALLEHQLPAMIFPRVDNGYGLLGHMYPNMFLYIPAVLRILRASVPFTMNLLYLSINIITAVTAYLAAAVFFEEKDQIYLFVILYIMLPYRLVNIYTRADLGEALAMCFVPLFFAGLYDCIGETEKKHCIRSICYITLGMSGIINSHVLSTAMMVAVAVIYALIFIRYILNKESVMIILFSVIWTALLNIGYIIPFIKMYLFGLNISHVTEEVLFTGKYRLWELLVIHDFSEGTAWGGISIIGDVGVIVLIIGIAKLFREERKRIDYFMIVSGILSILLLLGTISEFPWDNLISIGIIRSVASILEYSFRVMLIAAPLLTLVTVHFSYKIVNSAGGRKLVSPGLLLIACICILPGIIGEIKADPYINRLTGGASRVMLREYLPDGVEDGVFNETRLYWSSENLIIENYEKKGVRVDFDYYTLSDSNEWIEPPVLYYPGYCAKAYIGGDAKHRLGVSQGDEFRVKIDIPAQLSGSHVRLYYGGIWYFYIGYAISFISIIIFTWIMVRKSRSERAF